MSGRPSYNRRPITADPATWTTNSTSSNHILVTTNNTYVPSLIDTIKEMQEKIDKLEKKIQELEVLINIEKMVE